MPEHANHAPVSGWLLCDFSVLLLFAELSLASSWLRASSLQPQEGWQVWVRHTHPCRPPTPSKVVTPHNPLLCPSPASCAAHRPMLCCARGNVPRLLCVSLRLRVLLGCASLALLLHAITLAAGPPRRAPGHHIAARLMPAGAVRAELAAPACVPPTFLL